MKQATPILATIILLAFSGCTNKSHNTESHATPAPTQATATTPPAESVGPTDGKNWAGTGRSDDAYTLTTPTVAPVDVEKARELMGKETEKLTYIDVTVDNRKGLSPVTLAEASFTDTAGGIIRYEQLNTYLEGQDSITELSTEMQSHLTEIHHRYRGDQYEVQPGEKKTLTLATTSTPPQEITRALINDYVELTPTDKPADPRTEPTPTTTETPVTVTPEPTGTPTPEKKKLYAGVTNTGDDINFTILPDQTQADQNKANQHTGLVGSWGKICSTAASAEQLKETAVSTTNPAGETFVWRPLKYATVESELRLKDDDVTVLKKTKISELPAEKCEVVMVEAKNAVDYTYDAVAVGRYVSKEQIVDTVRIR